jgi:hypothetical protein
MADAQDAAFDSLTHAVTIARAQKALGDKARSEVYAAASRGELDLVKDGAKTLVTVESIRRYQASRPRAVIKPTQPRSAKRRRKSAAENFSAGTY